MIAIPRGYDSTEKHLDGCGKPTWHKLRLYHPAGSVYRLGFVKNWRKGK